MASKAKSAKAVKKSPPKNSPSPAQKGLAPKRTRAGKNTGVETGLLFAPAATAGEAATPPEPPEAEGQKPKAPVEETSEAEDAAIVDAAPDRKRKGDRFATAESMAKAQRNISVSEFFAKNRHLLGFDNPRKALLTTVKEAVDNSLDACEEAGISPVIEIAIQQLSETHFRVMVQDNGPGIVRKQVPNIFGKLLYGSKFHRLRMSRGQQGIGISAAGMHGLLTTGQPIRITSRTSGAAKAHFYELQIDTRKNQPDIIKDEPVEWESKHGTRVEIELEAKYQRGRQSVDDYLEQTAIANPHVTLVYRAPDGRVEQYQASLKDLPRLPRTIKPHPHGIELGVLIKMLQDTKAVGVQQFLRNEFSRVSPRVAQEIARKANLRENARVTSVTGDEAKAIYKAIQETKILAPATDCVVPVGEEQLLKGLQQVVPALFYAATSRRPAVYRGNPFIIEAAIAYGKPEAAEGTTTATAGPAGGAPVGDEEVDADTVSPAGSSTEDAEQSLAKVIRFANRVPLLYQQSACAIYKAVAGMNWRSYGLAQGRGALPSGDVTIAVHMASVWVPFTSESKEAIASYPEILKELRLALQDCGRKLGSHIRKTVRLRQEMKKRSYIEKYIPAIGEALRDILELKDKQVETVCARLRDVLERSRKL